LPDGPIDFPASSDHPHYVVGAHPTYLETTPQVLCLRLEVVMFLDSSVGPRATHAHCHSRERIRVSPSDRAELSSWVTTTKEHRFSPA